MKRKDIFKTGAAAILGVSLLMGGTSYAYLQKTTESVVNKFEAYIVNVDLSETTGSSYDIVPGHFAEKDPTVTVKAGLPVYVFVEVTDTTGGYVTYAIDEKWTALEGFPNVYYLVSDGAQDYSYNVLKGNQVAFPAQTNETMGDAMRAENGLNLTFQAHAIQKDPFATAQDAYQAILGEDAGEDNGEDDGIDLENAIVVETSEQLQAALTHVGENNVTVFVKNGAYDLVNGSHINGNNLTVVGESKDGVVINLGTSEACHRGQASILVDANNAVFKNLTLTNDSASEKSIMKSFEQHNVTLDGVNVINKGKKTAVNVHNGNAVIKNSSIQNTSGWNALPAVAATQSNVVVENTTVQITNPIVGLFGFNYAANSASYDDTTAAKLELNNVSGIIAGKNTMRITSERDGALGTNLDQVFWNGSLIEEDGDQGFKVTSYKLTKVKTYEKAL